MSNEKDDFEVNCIVDYTYCNRLNTISKAEKFIDIFIENLIKKFRYYNGDKFIITISEIKNFVRVKDENISYLLNNLNDLGFIINIEGNKKNIHSIDVKCLNVSKNEYYDYEYPLFNLSSIIELSSKTNIPVIGIFIMKIVAQTIIKLKIIYKAIVFDLDDTLWIGTLVEDGIEKIKDNMKSNLGVSNIAFMNFIKVLASELGIFIAICSRNDSENVRLAIENMDENVFPLKNQIDYIVANYNDKSENIKEIARHLSILPDSIVFLDDNKIIREEVRKKMPKVFVPEWTNLSDFMMQLIIGCIFERNELSINSQEKRKQYKILQTERKKTDLPKLFVKVRRDDECEETQRLYLKSNQFKLSAVENTDKITESIYFEIHRNDMMNLGICSALTYDVINDNCIIYNWAISCRYFEIGLEEFIVKFLLENLKINKITFLYQESEYNSKVRELFEKYPNIFKYNSNVIEVEYSQKNIDKFNSNTNLKMI